MVHRRLGSQSQKRTPPQTNSTTGLLSNFSSRTGVSTSDELITCFQAGRETSKFRIFSPGSYDVILVRDSLRPDSAVPSLGAILRHPRPFSSHLKPVISLMKPRLFLTGRSATWTYCVMFLGRFQHCLWLRPPQPAAWPEAGKSCTTSERWGLWEAEWRRPGGPIGRPSSLPFIRQWMRWVRLSPHWRISMKTQRACQENIIACHYCMAMSGFLIVWFLGCVFQ